VFVVQVQLNRRTSQYAAFTSEALALNPYLSACARASKHEVESAALYEVIDTTSPEMAVHAVKAGHVDKARMLAKVPMTVRQALARHDPDIEAGAVPHRIASHGQRP
jgi:hypothetical protein